MGDRKLISTSSSSSSTSIYGTRSYSYHPPSSSEEVFLPHIFDRSSPLPSYYSPLTMAAAENQRSFVSHSPSHSTLLSNRATDYSEVLLSSAIGPGSAAAGFGFSGSNKNALGNNSRTRVSSSTVGASGNETDEYDCESWEGVEAVVDEPHSKSRPLRTSTKRCRAPEVHNLSEKRRRSRINQKMKALQRLIPNSNKTDKASMLEEAIEYLKQLQLQVQMLTMKNGLNLHPMCLPGTALHPLQLSQTRPLVPPEATNDLLLNHTNQFASASNAPETINALFASYAMEPSIRSHFGTFPLLTSPVEMNQEDGFINQRLNIVHSNTNLTGEQVAFDRQEPDLKDQLS